MGIVPVLPSSSRGADVTGHAGGDPEQNRNVVRMVGRLKASCRCLSDRDGAYAEEQGKNEVSNGRRTTGDFERSSDELKFSLSVHSVRSINASKKRYGYMQ